MARIIKATTPGTVRRVDFEDEMPATAPTARIPGHRVHKQAAWPDPDPDAHRLKGILPARTARLAEQPVEVAALVWTPPRPPAPPAAEEPVEPEADAPLDVEALRAQQEAAWQAAMDEAVAAAREDGYRAGFDAARATLEADFEEQLRAYRADLDRLGRLWQDFMEASEPLLVQLAFEVAEAILEAPLSQAVKGISARTLSDVVEQLMTSAPLEIALHPVDFLRLQEAGAVEQLERLHPDLRWDPDSTLKQGDWIARSPAALIRRLERELVATLKSRLGLLALAQPKK